MLGMNKRGYLGFDGFFFESFPLFEVVFDEGDDFFDGLLLAILELLSQENPKKLDDF